eukprot:6240276-Karenia_brevis.AAC.1
MEEPKWDAYKQAYLLSDVIMTRAAQYKIGDTTLGTMIARSPEVLSLLAPKGTKRGKSHEVNMFVAYSAALRSLVQLDEAMNQLPDENFQRSSQHTVSCEETSLVPAPATEDVQLPFIPESDFPKPLQ